MGSIKLKIVDFLLNRTPVVKQILALLDGYKTQLGTWGTFISSALLLAAQVWPQYAVLTQVQATFAVVLSWLFQQLGLAHKEMKGQLDTSVNTESQAPVTEINE